MFTARYGAIARYRPPLIRQTAKAITMGSMRYARCRHVPAKQPTPSGMMGIAATPRGLGSTQASSGTQPCQAANTTLLAAIAWGWGRVGVGVRGVRGVRERRRVRARGGRAQQHLPEKKIVKTLKSKAKP